MSDKFPMVAVDKVTVVLTMKVGTVVRLDRIAKSLGIASRSSVMNSMIDEAVKDVVLEAEDVDKIKQMIGDNIKRREHMKLLKGMKQ